MLLCTIVLVNLSECTCRAVVIRYGGSIPAAAILILRQFCSPHITEETLKAGGPFYLVSMPGEVQDPTPGVNV